MRLLLGMKPQISWQEQVLNIRSHDLNQLCSISVGVTKKVITDWTDINHKRHCESTTGLKQEKGYIRTLCQKNEVSVEIRQRSIRWVVGLLTGDCHIK
jgi:hypothetical protein